MGNNLGYRTITKLDDAGLKALNDTLRVLWDKLLGNVEYKDLGGSARKVIDSKASGEAVSELSGMYAQLETVVSQTQEEILLRATKEDLDKLQADVQVQADEIKLKASKEEVIVVSQAAAGAANAASNAQNTADNAAQAAQQAQNAADEAQAGTEALAGRVTKAESKLTVQADEIALRVTKTQHEADLSGKLNADAPAIGVQTASAVVNEKGVYLSGGEIDMRTTDGEDYLNLSSAGVSASSMSAPDVMPRYAGPVVLYVDPNATSEQIDTGAYFRSIQEACNQLNHKFIPAWTCILLTQTEFYENATLSGCVCPEGIRIAALYNEKHPTIHGTIAFNYCTGYINTRYLKIQPSTDSHGINCYGPGAILVAEYCVMTSGKLMSDSYYGIYANMGARVVLANCEIYNYRYSVCAGRMSSMLLNGGNKGNGSVAASGAIVHMTGSVPSYISGQLSIEKWRGGEVFYSPDNTTWADQGSGGSTPAVPTVNTLSVGTNAAVSYRANGGVWSSDSVIQGWWNGGGRIKGCMWFDNASIRNALSGKTVLTASLRLHMNSSGRGTQVTVERAGTGANSGGGNPAVTREYGTIATMSPKETQTITIPVQAVNDLVNGTINGLMLYSSDTGSYKERDYSKNYAAFAGYGDDATKPMLTITYS